MQTLKLASSATIQLGTGAGGAVLNFANSSAVAWNAGTLTITSWNGNAAGGGSDRIYMGTDATGLTASQLAQVKWVNPLGSGDVTGAAILSTGEIVPVLAPTITPPVIVNGEIVFDVIPGSPTQKTMVQRATNLTPPVDWVDVGTEQTGRYTFSIPATLDEAFFRVDVH
jgi:hypothetical protein